MSELLGKGKSSGGGGSTARDISITNRSSIVVPQESSFYEQYDCEVFISIDKDAPDESKPLIVKHYMEIKGDDAANSIIDRLQSEILDADAEQLNVNNAAHSPVYNITKSGARFIFRTAAVSPRFHRETETVVKSHV